MPSPRYPRRRPVVTTLLGVLGVTLLVGVLAQVDRQADRPVFRQVNRQIAPRPSPGPRAASTRAAAREPAAAAPASLAAAAVTPSRPPPPLGTLPDAGARAAATALLADSAAARRRGDLRATLALLQAAVERTPAVETHAALGALYLELAVPRAAETNLRAAAEGDPGNADRWIALANALALKPDPLAAAGALEHARAAEPGLRVTRDPGGWLVREPARPAP